MLAPCVLAREVHEKAVLVVFTPDFEVAFGVLAHWAFAGCLIAFVDVAAVSAFPLDRCIFLEDLA
jgi:hypothetical protein